MSKRVPAAFASLDDRGIVHMSTKVRVVDDPNRVRAQKVAEGLLDSLEAYWRGLRDGQSVEAKRRYDAARLRARDLGFTYQSVAELSQGDLDQILDRVGALSVGNRVESEQDFAALLGGEDVPPLKLSGLVSEFEELEATKLEAYSPDQLRRWRNPKRRAVQNLIDIVGDKPIGELTRSDALDFRKHWQDRVLREGLAIGTANKDIGHVSIMLTKVDIAYQMGLSPVFQRLRLEGEVDGQRLAFSTPWLRDTLFAPGALDGLNPEAAGVLGVMADTGMRLSEVANLRPEHIFLDAPVPYVRVFPVGRILKTRHSEREIPLVGVALRAMQANPYGFERYHDKGASLSGLLNKFLRNNGLLESENHSAYGLRHSFEDRLTAVEAPEKIMTVLMGHKWHRPRYGAGPSLAQKQEWLNKIVF